MQIKVNITSLLCIWLIFLLYECERAETKKQMIKCASEHEIEYCAKIYRGYP
jgi:hypothetical protein